MEVLELVPQILIDFVIIKTSEWFGPSCHWTDSQKFHHLFCLLLKDPTIRNKMDPLLTPGCNPYRVMLFTVWLANLYYCAQEQQRKNPEDLHKEYVNEINGFVNKNCASKEALLILMLISTYTPSKLRRKLNDVIVKPTSANENDNEFEHKHKRKEISRQVQSHLYDGKDHTILFDVLNDITILNTLSIDNFNKEIQQFISNLPIQTNRYRRTEARNLCINYYLRIKDRKIKTVMGKILAQSSHDYIEDYVRSQEHLLQYATVSPFSFLKRNK